MAVLAIDGFDKYGPPGQSTPTVASLLTAGEWTSLSGSSVVSIVAGLSGSGQALTIGTGTGPLTKTLVANYARLIGGVRFSATLVGAVGVEFLDGGTAQCSITINSAGTISLRTGGLLGTAIVTSTATVSANSTHYLEWDISFSATGAYQVWLDGVSIFAGTGNTKTSANNYANQFGLSFGNASAVCTYDDFYLFDNTGATCNAVLLNNPIVETALPSSDVQKQWAAGATIIGIDNSAASGASAPTANNVNVRSFTAAANMTLNSISVVPSVANGAANYRAVVYASAATGAALLASGPTVTGTTAGATLTLPLTTPLVLTGGVSYAIGFMSDTAVNHVFADSGNAFSRGTVTFASGAPSVLPAMTGGNSSFQCWGNCTGAGTNYTSVNYNPAIDDIAYVWSPTVGQEDLYGFPPLSSNPASIACVAMKARVKRSDSGSRSVDVRCASGSADTAGTAAGIVPGSTFGWIGNYLPLDPNTGIAWTGSAVNAASGGVRVAS